MDMVQAGLSYLAAADAAQLATVTQAECLRGLERADAIATAAQASLLAGFMAGKGYADDADYGARSWLIHKTHITAGAAVGHTAWARRVATHPRVIAALAAGQHRHQGIAQRVPTANVTFPASPQPIMAPNGSAENPVLNGLINEYTHAA